VRLLPSLVTATLAAIPAVAGAQTADSLTAVDPIQGSLTMIFGGFAVVVVLAVTIASHQRP
jgi:hypothetical protein